MKIINVAQGTPEWHAHRAQHFNASDAAAMHGVSKYCTRTKLLHRFATGETEDVTPDQQRIFDCGHASEAMARPIVEELIGEELFPAVGVSEQYPRLSASFDGITMDGETGFEHKLWNADLAEKVRTGAIADDPAYYWQLEQQILVAGLERVIFVCSDGTRENMEYYTYTARPGRREQLLAGWAQFEADLASYTPREVKPEVVAEPVTALPAIVYTIDRTTMALASNLPEFKAAAMELVERTKAPLETDQDFADREALCKAFGEAEKLLKMKAEEVVGQIADVAEFSRELGNIAEMFRTARLASEKLVEAEKKNRRAAIQQSGANALSAHLAGLNAQFAGRVTLPPIPYDFAAAIKGKRTLESIQNAVDTELARWKIAANAAADSIAANLRALDELAPDHGFLFRDLQQLVAMPSEAFRATVEGRVASHKAAESARLEAERDRIRMEEAEKLARQQSTQESAPVVSSASTVVSAPAGQQTSSVSGLTLKRRPTLDEMVAVLASHYQVREDTVLGWLQSSTEAIA